MKFAILSLAIFLVGCANVPHAQVGCDAAEVESIATENSRLLAEKARITEFANGKPIPGMVWSSLSEADVVSAMKRGYNISLDRLLARAQTCNGGKFASR